MSEPESEKLPINLIRPKAESSSPQPVAAPQKVVETKKSVNEESKAPESAPRLLPAASPSISTYNGGKTNKYAWSQSINEVTVEIQLDQKTTSNVSLGKQLSVELKNSGLRVAWKRNNEVIVEGKWHDRIKVEDSTWMLEDGNKVVLHLEKASENIWKTVLEGDEEIDATKVDNSKRVDEFDEETQGALRKIVYEQNRKMAGLPTSEEEQQMEILKKAWDAEGSPFKGQPFDPSKINLTGGGAANMFKP